MRVAERTKQKPVTMRPPNPATTRPRPAHTTATRDAGLDFSEDYLIAGEELTIEFQSGSLAGMSFGVRFNPDAKDPAEQLWEIVPNENYGRLLPDDVLCPSNGDQYVLSGFDISLVADQYVPAAEQELLSRAREYAERAANDDGTYTGRLLSDWVADAPVARDFRLGQRVELFAPGIFESARQSRVIGWTKALDLPYDQPEYTFGESTAYSRLGDVEGKVETLIYRGQTYVGLGTGSGGPYVITSNDPTPPPRTPTSTPPSAPAASSSPSALTTPPSGTSPSRRAPPPTARPSPTSWRPCSR